MTMKEAAIAVAEAIRRVTHHAMTVAAVAIIKVVEAIKEANKVVEDIKRATTQVVVIKAVKDNKCKID